MRYVRFPCLVVPLLLSTSAVAGAAEVWTLTTADFQSRPVQLRGIGEQGVAVSAPGAAEDQQQIVPLDQFLEVTRTVPAGGAGSAAPFNLHMASGDQLAGQPASMQDEKLTWESPALGQITFPLSQIRAIVRSGQSLPHAADEPRTEDVVLLANGDSVRGVVGGLEAGAITVQAGGDATPVPLDSVTAILLASTAAQPAPVGRAFRLRLDDGSSVVASSVLLEGAQAALTLPDQSSRQLPLARLVGVEQINGPVSWLSARTPSENVQTPYDGELTWPAKMDRSVGGKPIRFGEQTYARGIGVHAYSRLVYPLDDGQYKAFRTQYAIDTSATDGRFANVTVRVKLGDRIVHDQKDVRAGVLSPVVVLPLENAGTLTLEVDYGPTGDRQARLNWIEPALLREVPPPATGPASAPRQ